MNFIGSLIIGVLMLLDPSGAKFAPEGADARASVPAKPAAKKGSQKIRISAKRSDFDRKEGVIMFEKDATVESGKEYFMRADRLFAFFAGTNSLERIVAIGNVALTNAARHGSCPMATYLRASDEIVMFGDAKESAMLTEAGKNVVSGKRIKFWIDEEQVEVEGAQITIENKSKGVLKP